MNLNINKKSYILRSIPSILARIFFILFSIYWIYRAVIINANILFFLIGIFFFSWSLSSILLPIFIPLKKIYYIEDNNLIIFNLIFKKKIPLDKIVDCKLKKTSYFDKKFNTYRAEITTNNGYEDYFELYGLISDFQLSNIIKKFSKREKDLDLPKKKEKKEFKLPKKTIKIVSIILLLILIIILLKIFYSNIFTSSSEKVEITGMSIAPPKDTLSTLDNYDKNKFKKNIPIQNNWLLFEGEELGGIKIVKDYVHAACEHEICRIFHSEEFEGPKDISLNTIYSMGGPIWVKVEKGDYIFALNYKGCSLGMGFILALKNDGNWFNLHQLILPCSDKEFTTKYYEFSIENEIEAISFQYDFSKDEVLMFKNIELKKS